MTTFYDLDDLQQDLKDLEQALAESEIKRIDAERQRDRAIDQEHAWKTYAIQYFQSQLQAMAMITSLHQWIADLRDLGAKRDQSYDEQWQAWQEQIRTLTRERDHALADLAALRGRMESV